MKLLMMIAAGSAILVGLLSYHGTFVVVGATIYLLASIADLFYAYRDAKLLRAGALQAEPYPPLSVRIARWIKGVITLTGLVLVVVARRTDAGGFALGGWIIWGGAIACYLTSGIIAGEVGGIPLSMGYGGWAVRRDRKGNIRR